MIRFNSCFLISNYPLRCCHVSTNLLLFSVNEEPREIEIKLLHRTGYFPVRVCRPPPCDAAPVETFSAGNNPLDNLNTPASASTPLLPDLLLPTCLVLSVHRKNAGIMDENTQDT